MVFSKFMIFNKKRCSKKFKNVEKNKKTGHSVPGIRATAVSILWKEEHYLPTDSFST